MGEHSNIEWCSATWNPWMGCTKVSPGCAHCYMFREQRQYGNDPELVRRSKTKFREPVKWADGRLVFTCSWSDWFHEGADAWRDEAWAVIQQTPQHTYQILTKRPERMAGRIPWGDYGDPWPNVWLGVSVENQRFAERADQLVTVPAAVRFVSAEPLLGPLRFSGATMRGLHWLIAGGESGPEHRPTDEQWLRDLRDDCAHHRVAFFLKQLGGPTSNKRGGADALLDGLRYTEMPSVAASRGDGTPEETT